MQSARTSGQRRRFGGWTLLLLGLLASPGCADTSPDGRFASEVVPVLERRCSNQACHGVARKAVAEPGADASEWLTFEVDGSGRITDVPGALASAKSRVDADGVAALSTLLRKTLPLEIGGLRHSPGEVFASREAADYRTLARWAESVDDGTEGADEPPLTALEQTFAATVQPILVERRCATSTCHGELNFGVGAFARPVDAAAGAISRAELRESYRNARANITLWGEAARSRLLAKILPLGSGGIPHKGGNDEFFAAAMEQGLEPLKSAQVKAILAWIEAERAEALGEAADRVGVASALVAVGGPVQLADPFDHAPFTPGTDLYRFDTPLAGRAPVNLTASAHAAPADVRDPAVSHDGLILAFAMRRSAADAFNIYTIGVDGGGLRQLTHDSAASSGRAGAVTANVQPVFGPADATAGGGERLYFVSSRTGEPSDDSRFQGSDLYVMDVDGANLERLTWTLMPEVRPTFLASGEFAGSLAYTVKRSAEGGYKGVVFRFPVDHNTKHHLQAEAHPHFGMSEPPHVFLGLRETASGRGVVALLDEGNRALGGQLAMLERQFAVEIPAGDEGKSTLPGFRHALTILTPEAARAGLSADGLWRDPTPMPDGSVVVAHAPGPIDLNAPPAALRPDLLRLTLTEDRATQQPMVAATEVLTTAPEAQALAWSEPVGVFPRGLEDGAHERAWNDTDTHGLLAHSGVQVIEAVLARMAPTGPRTLRDDIAYVRAVAPLDAVRPVDAEPVAAAETRDGHEGATNLALTGRMPLFVAFELPPAPDGSLAAHIPAKVSVRLVTLDASFMAVGTLQHHWYAVAPGERFPVGIPDSAFSVRCAGCHGAMSGKRDAVLRPPTDFVTQASITASLYEDSDRHKPLEPPVVGPESFRMVDFREDVQPILDARCVACHDGAAAEADLTLSGAPTTHYTDAYESLLRPGAGSAGGFEYVDAVGYRGRRSHLIERLRGAELDAARTVDGVCPPAGSPGLTPDELATLVRWIELGAAFVGR